MEFKQVLTFQSTKLLNYLEEVNSTYKCTDFVKDNSRYNKIARQLNLDGHNPIWVFQPTNTILIDGTPLFLDERFISAYDIAYKFIPTILTTLNLPYSPDSILEDFFHDRYLYEFRVPTDMIHNDNLSDAHTCGTLPYVKYHQLVSIYKLECLDISIEDFLKGKPFVTITPIGNYSKAGMLNNSICIHTNVNHNLYSGYVDNNALLNEYNRQLYEIDCYSRFLNYD